MAKKKVNQSLNSAYLEKVLKAAKQLKNSESAKVGPAGLETVIEKMKLLNPSAKLKSDAAMVKSRKKDRR